MSDVKIFQMVGGSPSRSLRQPTQEVELVDDLSPSEKLDDRLTRLEHVPGDGVWAKRRALGEGNRLGLVRGNSGGGCNYIIQARVPDPALQPVYVRRLDEDEVEQIHETATRSWATDEDEDIEDKIVHVRQS